MKINGGVLYKGDNSDQIMTFGAEAIFNFVTLSRAVHQFNTAYMYVSGSITSQMTLMTFRPLILKFKINLVLHPYRNKVLRRIQ